MGSETKVLLVLVQGGRCRFAFLARGNFRARDLLHGN